MDAENKAGNSTQKETVLPPYAPETVKREKIVFKRRDWIDLAVSLGLGVYPALAFSLRTLFNSPNLPGIGSALFFLAALAAGVCAIGKKGHWNQSSLLVLASGAICALTLGVWSYFPMRALNHLAAFLLIALGLLSASGTNRFSLTQAGMLCESFVNIFSVSFSHVFKPFSALSGTASGKRRTLLGIVIGFAVALPLLALVIGLLSSADAAFSAFLQRMFANMQDLDLGSVLWHGMRVVFFTLVFFSIFYALRHPKNVRRHMVSEISIPASLTGTVLVLLNLIYGVFFSVQLSTLFGTAQTAAAQGGYAEYARTGFFQLVAVSAINLAALLAAGCVSREHRGVRVFSVVLCAQTAVLLASAVWRMCLYIGAYGLSFLRLATFFIMAAIACALILCIVKSIRPDFKVFPVLAAFVLVLWVGFSVLDTSRIVAAYNVDAYLDGRCETIDVDYLASLSPSVVPVLQRLADAGNSDAADAIAHMAQPEYRLYLWSVDRLTLESE